MSDANHERALLQRLAQILDAPVIQTVNEPATAEAAYTQRSVIVPPSFADGASHRISFEYDNPAGSGTSNFKVDDVTLETSGGTATPSPTPAPTPRRALPRRCRTSP